MTKPFSFGRKEKLKSRKAIKELFAIGSSLSIFPLRVSYRFSPAVSNEPSNIQVGVTVSSRHFKRAVDRNRIKRLLRECYRLQKKELLLVMEQRGLRGLLFFIYVDKKMPDYNELYLTVGKSLQVLLKHLPANEKRN
ncbi:MAG TPA: ribonuclease P protein component [Chitinophagaceae bacterium]|nr:ribonuclease P protein component [Chitinophagaceae bacterium]